jgi:hypothetical protein
LTKVDAEQENLNNIPIGDGEDSTANTDDEGGTEKEPRFSGDSFWKDLVEEYFYSLLKRALPELYADADINVKPKFLDKEFTDVLKTADPKEHNSPHFSDFVVLYAAKHAAKAKGEYQKYSYLRKATKLLAERGWTMEEKRKLMLYMERVMNLKDEKIKTKYWEYQKQLDKEEKIMYVSIAEEKGIEKGIEKGTEKTKFEDARKLLARGISTDIIAESTELPQEKIRALMN